VLSFEFLALGCSEAELSDLGRFKLDSSPPSAHEEPLPPNGDAFSEGDASPDSLPGYGLCSVLSFLLWDCSEAELSDLGRFKLDGSPPSAHEEPLPPNVDPLSADDAFNINSLADHSLDEDTSSAGPANIAILASKLLLKASILNSALYKKLK
jgi:hypothetical protein